MKISSIKKLNKFTTLPVLLDLLQRKRLTLLDPKLWEDKNDSELILAYKKRKGIKNLFALCFSYNDETIHHWKTYSPGPSGCLIEFDAPKLFAIFDAVPTLRHGKVIYKKLSEIEGRNTKIDYEKIPFIKRWPYRCEDEYRVIVEPDQKEDFFEIDIPLNLIRKITINQQMPRQIYETIKSYLREAKGNPDSRINRSTLYENKRWINVFKK